MLTAVLFVLGEFALCMALVPLLERGKQQRGVLIQGSHALQLRHFRPADAGVALRRG